MPINNLLSIYEDKILECDRSIKQLDFTIESINESYRLGILNNESSKIQYLKNIELQKKVLRDLQDEYFYRMIDLKQKAG